MNGQNVVQTFLDNLDVAITQLEGGEAKAGGFDFKLEEFWVSLIVAANSVSTEITQLCVLFSKPPLPNIQQIDGILRKIESAYIGMLSHFYNLPKCKGIVLRKKIQVALLKLILSISALIKSLKETGAKSQKDRLKLAGWIWEACEALQRLPRSNLEATFDALDRDSELVEDALQEIEDEVKSQESGTDGDVAEEIDNSERWNNQDRELLPPCIALVRTARSCLRRIIRAVKQQGHCNTEHETAQLDDLVAAVHRLSPAVDEFVSSVYPPMNRGVVKRTALDVVKELQAILGVVKQSHYVKDDDQTWVTFLLNAVDHNNNKLQIGRAHV